MQQTQEVCIFKDQTVWDRMIHIKCEVRHADTNQSDATVICIHRPKNTKEAKKKTTVNDLLEAGPLSFRIKTTLELFEKQQRKNVWDWMENLLSP